MNKIKKTPVIFTIFFVIFMFFSYQIYNSITSKYKVIQPLIGDKFMQSILYSLSKSGISGFYISIDDSSADINVSDVSIKGMVSYKEITIDISDIHQCHNIRLANIEFNKQYTQINLRKITTLKNINNKEVLSPCLNAIGDRYASFINLWADSNFNSVSEGDI
ncbi:hypothetical protein [Photobacterium leiognathi]|uniref:hypothetical protein n=1 Tax=Photobacterium leiognathi TaxID=553611 RepID=UPI0029826EBC|nr:hypothetical protein [Photobacterium leiognathi]